MIEALFTLLACQLVGEVANRFLALPLPGPVTGMGLLFLVLYWRGRRALPGDPAVPRGLAGVADTLLRHLSLLYVPASVGIIARLDLLRAHPLAIGAAVVVSTILAQGLTALVFERLLRRQGRPYGIGADPMNVFVFDVAGLRSFLSSSPLFWLAATLGVYALAERVAIACRRHPLMNPVIVATAIIGAALMASGTSYATYFDGAQFVHFLLGPATVSLAVPLYRNLGRIQRALLPMLAALLCGASVAIVTAVVTAGLLGAPRDILASLAPKSVTTPIAMTLSEAAGGLPTLTVSLVIVTGITGALIWTPLMAALGIRNRAAQGFAAGLASHGVGAARAFQVDAVAGAFAGIGLGLTGAITALLIPLLLPPLLRLFT